MTTIETEFIVACRYVELPDTEVGCIPGVAYKKDGKITTELLCGTEYNVSVLMLGAHDPEMVFAVHHVFVERYIKQILGMRFEDVEIYRLYIAHGDFPERPSDLRGEMASHFLETEGKSSWFSREHISGPYLADVQLLVSQFTAGRLADISAKVPKNLIPERAAYLENPQDLPLLGIVPISDQTTSDQKFLEDLLIRTHETKPEMIQ